MEDHTPCNLRRTALERAAIGRVPKHVHSQQCNCVHITRVANRSFLGAPYPTVFAHSRHIQDNFRFQSERYPEEQGVTGDHGTGAWEDEGGASRNQALPYGRGCRRLNWLFPGSNTRHYSTHQAKAPGVGDLKRECSLVFAGNGGFLRVGVHQAEWRWPTKIKGML